MLGRPQLATSTDTAPLSGYAIADIIEAGCCVLFYYILNFTE